MILKKKIPKEFYKLFRTKNRDAYMQFLVAIYEENNEVYTALGLTIEECRVIIADTIAKARIIWEDEEIEEEDEDEAEDIPVEPGPGPVIKPKKECAKPLQLPKEERDRIPVLQDDNGILCVGNISFPEYSQLFTELFQKLQTEDDSRERESILSIYSALFTYHSDTEKNNDILKNALQTSRRLGQLLSNMQDGMRSYFEELSQKKNFIGIQKVLVEEINNSDSKKYAILTTTDSFYRYKEAVKELISQILRENDQKREQLVKERTGLVEGTVTSKRNQYRLEYCESASQLVYQVEREFDLIEKKYNKLIEQKTVFAKRALARIHYILQEGSSDEDHIVKLINLLDHHANSPQVLEQMRDRIRVGTQFKNITDRSFYNRKNAEDAGFHPIAMEKHNEETQMTDFVPKPLYTKKQLQEFRQKNIVDGRFVTDEQTIQSVEDLEKLLFLWQEETDDTKQEETVHIDGELKGEYGFVFSKLVIDAKKGEKK